MRLLLLFCCLSVNVLLAQHDDIKWYTWEEAMELGKETPKKYYIDLYTDWCSWCKYMDQTTFTNRDVAALLNEHFYPIKFNAEQKDSIMFNGKKFGFVDNGGRGFHDLAFSLTKGQLGYPSFVFLDEEYTRIMVSPGYKDEFALQEELNFAIAEAYKKMSFEDYQARGSDKATTKTVQKLEKKARKKRLKKEKDHQ